MRQEFWMTARVIRVDIRGRECIQNVEAIMLTSLGPCECRTHRAWICTRSEIRDFRDLGDRGARSGVCLTRRKQYYKVAGLRRLFRGTRPRLRGVGGLDYPGDELDLQRSELALLARFSILLS